MTTIHIDNLHITLNRPNPTPVQPSVRPRFELRKDYVLDHKLNVMWSADESAKELTLENAEKYAGECRLGGFTDWRLPDQDELQSLRDLSKHNPCIDTNVFKSNASYVWTRTPEARSSGLLWVVNFSGGYVDLYYRYYKCFVRPVRDMLPGEFE
jgi:hypothetical protein